MVALLLDTAVERAEVNGCKILMRWNLGLDKSDIRLKGDSALVLSEGNEGMREEKQAGIAGEIIY